MVQIQHSNSPKLSSSASKLGTVSHADAGAILGPGEHGGAKHHLRLRDDGGADVRALIRRGSRGRCVGGGVHRASLVGLRLGGKSFGHALGQID